MEWIIAAVVAVGGLAGAIWRAYARGRRNAEEAAERQAQIEHSQRVEYEYQKARDVQEAQRRVGAGRDGDAARRLRDNWRRD